MEVLNCLTVRSHTRAQMGRGQGPRFTPGEVASMLSGLPRSAACLAYAKFGLDTAASDELAAWLHVAALEARKRQGWDIDPNDRKLSLLALLVRDDLTLSRPKLGRKQAADRLGVSERQWRAVWCDRHAHLLNVGHGWHSAITYALVRQLRGSNG